MNDKYTVFRILKKVRNRLWCSFFVDVVCKALFVVSVLCLALVTVAHTVPIVNITYKCAVVSVCVCSMGIVYAVIKRPSLKETALVADRVDLMDRMSTYLEYMDKQSEVLDLFREEAEEVIRSFDFKTVFKIKIDWKVCSAGILIFAVSVCVYFIPSPSMKEAVNRHETNLELREEAKKLENIYKQLKDDNTQFNDKVYDKNQVLNVLDELQKSLEEGYSREIAMQHVAESMDRLDGLGYDMDSKSREMLAGIFEGTGDNGKKIKEALNTGVVKQAMEQARISNFDKSDKKKMLANIEKLLNTNQPLQPDLKNALKRIKTGLKDDTVNGQNISETLSSVLSEKDNGEFPEKLKVKLEEMSERLMSKDDGFQGYGKQRAEHFTKGENNGTGSGEFSNGEIDETALGDTGDRHARSSQGMGGGEGKDGANNGSVLKQREMKRGQDTLRGQEELQASFIKGRQQDEFGAIKDKKSDEVLETKGEVQQLDALYKEFGKTTAEYMDKDEIPVEYREFVAKYFDSLDGGVRDGKP